MDEIVAGARELWKAGLQILASEGVLSLALTLSAVGMIFPRFNAAAAAVLGALASFVVEYVSAPGAYGYLFVSDELSRQACLVSDLTFAGAAALAWAEQRSGRRYPGEHFALMTAMNLGVHLTAKATHGLAAFTGMELTALSAYVLTALSDGERPERSAEAAVKFMLLGAVASAVFLYGWSWYFGTTGGLKLAGKDAGTVAATLLSVGLLMKLGGVPLHFWAPDVYAAGPTSLVAPLAGPSKLAGFVLLFRIFPAPSSATTHVALVLGAASLLVGNLSALRQTEFRRLLGYSSIAHTGLMLLLFAGGNGARAAIYYLSLYSAINFLAAVMTGERELRTGTGDMSSWKGTGVGTATAVGWAVAAGALAGLPLTAGFAAKVYALLALWNDLGAGWTLFALFNAVVALFVYFKAPSALLLSPAAERPLAPTPKSFLALIALAVTIVIFLGLWGWGGKL
jgi:NADH-quinone oxidoreductase subunit N